MPPQNRVPRPWCGVSRRSWIGTGFEIIRLGHCLQWLRGLKQNPSDKSQLHSWALLGGLFSQRPPSQSPSPREPLQFISTQRWKRPFKNVKQRRWHTPRASPVHLERVLTHGWGPQDPWGVSPAPSPCTSIPLAQPQQPPCPPSSSLLVPLPN